MEQYRYEYDKQEREAVDLVVSRRRQGTRLDLVVSALLPRVSRNMVQALIRAGDIQVNKTIVRPAYRVKEGDWIAGTAPVARHFERIPCGQPVFLVHVDDQIAVVDKPAGMLVHPVRGDLRGSLISALHGLLGPGEYHTVHRLDRDTSGVLVLGRTIEAGRFLSRQFRQRRIKKRYQAIVLGAGMPEHDWIEFPLDGHAVTEFHVRRRYTRFAVLDLYPLTGRRHQLRRHLSMRGFPIAGDRFYGGGDLINRPALHAMELRFIHPGSRRELTVRVPPPLDFQSWLHNLRRLGRP